MLKRLFASRNKRFQQLSLVLVVIVVALIGTRLLIGSHAATPYSSATADKGTLTGAAVQQGCSGASDNNCVVFGSKPGTTPSSTIIGINGAGAGETSQIATRFSSAGFRWDRIEFDMPSMSSNYDGVSNDTTYGFSSVAEINTGDNTALSCTVLPSNCVTASAYASYGLSLIQANPNIKLWEVGNEMYLKGCLTFDSNGNCTKRVPSDPVDYGKMYLALYNLVKANNISGVTLMFNMFGDYDKTGNGNWSQDANNGGWLRDAVNGNPGLAAAIASEALSTHPYGGIGVNNADEEGTASVAAQESVAQTVLGSIPPFYITEFGYNLGDISDGTFTTVCGSNTQESQAYLLTEAYNIFLADPHVKGIWWYAAHDDGTGQFGLVNLDSSFNLTSVRPSFNALAQELDLKQHTPSCSL